MSHITERPRRLSYAGLARPPQQKSRRVSDVGQSGNISETVCMTLNNGTITESEPVSSMLQDCGRYEMNVNRPTRRPSRPSRDDSLNCSQQSVLSAMDRFVKAVNNMDSTVLVPSRLQDMEVSENSKFSKCLSATLNNSDVYRFYTMLKDVKNELLWGPTAVEPMHCLPSSGRSSPSNTSRVMKHIRQPSDDSLGSTGFPSDQETDSDIESVVTDRDSMDDQSTTNPGSHLASAFRHHLLGLHTILHELADSADFLSSRYQEEIEASSL